MLIIAYEYCLQVAEAMMAPCLVKKPSLNDAFGILIGARVHRA